MSNPQEVIDRMCEQARDVEMIAEFIAHAARDFATTGDEDDAPIVAQMRKEMLKAMADIMGIDRSKALDELRSMHAMAESYKRQED